MKKVVHIILAILMVACLALSITACASECDKGNHAWDNGTVTKAPTCVDKGVKTYKCANCDATKTENIDATGVHTPISADIDATCTTAGVSGATKCDVCGTSIAAGTTIPALEHNVTTWTPCADDDTKHEGICTREGCGVKVTALHVPNADETACKDCGKSLVTVVEPHDHDYTGAVWTATADGTKHQATCTVEGCTEVKIEDHTPETVEGFAATCTTAGQEDGSKCSLCDHVISTGAPIPALQHNVTTWTLCADDETKHEGICTREGCGEKVVQDHAWNDGTVKVEADCVTALVTTYTCTACGHTQDVTGDVDNTKHDYYTAWTAVDAAQHAHYCKREGCNAYGGATSHTYAANHCADCDNTITQQQIIELMADLLENGRNNDYLISSNSTFVLTGIYDGLGDYKDNYRLVDDDGNLIIICYKLDFADLIEGDKITVTGKIKKYSSTIEFDQGCTYELVKRGDVTITWIKADDITDDGMVNKAERNSTVVFNVPHADDAVVVVRVNGSEITANANGEYSFEANANTTVEILVYGANETRPHRIHGELTLTTDNIPLTGSYNTKEDTQSFEFNNANITFAWTGVCNQTGFQFSAKNGLSELYNKNEIIGLASITLNNLSIGSGKIVVTFAKNADFTDAQVVNGVSGVYTAPVGGYTYFKITETNGKAVKMASIAILCDSYCENTTAFTEHSKQDATCTEDGTIKHWTCDICGAKFDDELHNNLVTDVVAPAKGHSVSKVDAQAADCSKEENGNIEYYECDVCHRYFQDLEAETELTEQDIVIPYQHDLVYQPEDPATSTTAGKEAHWKCSVCDACFEDEEGLKKITDDNWGYIPPITGCDHENTVWIINEDGSHSKQCTNCSDLLPLNANGDTSCNDELIYTSVSSEKHVAMCECGYESEEEDHVSDGNYKYFMEGAHVSDCSLCGYKDYVEKCAIVNGACEHCHRIVGEKSKTAFEEVGFQGMYNANTNLDGMSFGQIITMAFYKNGAGTDIRYWKDDDGIRCYSKNKITITSANNYIITKVEFTGSVSFTANTGSVSSRTWEGSATSIDLQFSGSGTFTVIKITYNSTSNCFHEDENAFGYHEASTTLDCGVNYYSAACYYCEACGKSFADKACTEEIEVEIRKATEHNYGELHLAVAPDCVTDEIKQNYYHCSECGLYFDEDHNKITADDIFGDKDPDAHDYEWKVNDDLSHYQQCTRNEEHTTELCNGNNGTAYVYTDNDNGTHNVKCNACGIFERENVTCVYDDETHECICGHKQTVTVTLAIDGRGAQYATITLKVGETEILTANGSVTVEYGSVVNITVIITDSDKAAFASITIGNADPITELETAWNTANLTDDITIAVIIDGMVEPTWKRITSVDALDTNSEYILVCEDNDVVAGEVGSNKYMGKVGATINSNNEIESLPVGAVKVKIEGTTGSYKLHIYDQEGNSLGYYTTTAAKSMSLTDSGTSCAITFSGNNVSIVFGSYGTLKYNASAPRFVTYASGQTDIQLYKLS